MKVLVVFYFTSYNTIIFKKEMCFGCFLVKMRQIELKTFKNAQTSIIRVVKKLVRNILAQHNFHQLLQSYF